ncbi:MAG: family 10 glycosylhydrolase [Bacteroidaceae bacterium]|nr:family 10 glycosylhydrolase [Bacteroidaceae bacterium]
MKRRIYVYYTLLLFCCSVATFAQMPWNTDALYPKRETRAVWVTTLGGLDWPKNKATSADGRERQQRELCQLLDQLQAANINTVILQTRVRGSVIYPSQLEPWDVALTGQFDGSPGYDPLAFAIEETHRRGMELHAWVVTIPAFKQNVARKMGRRGLYRSHPELLRKHNDMYYLDPGLPGTADYLRSICREIVERYDVDGLHFDYIRYPENAGGFADGASYKKYGKGQSKAAWRRDNITRIVRSIYHDVKARKPWVKVSCSPVGKYRDTRRYSSRGWNCYDAVYQDAQGWLQEGIQDALFPMMYFDGDHFYPFAADWKEGCFGRHVVPGLGIYFLDARERNWPLQVITRQLHYVREQGLAGQCYFRSRFLTDNTKGLYDYLLQTFYAYPALTPAYPWLDAEAPSAPTGVERQPLDEQRELLTWTASTDNLPAGGVTYCLYASDAYPVDVSRVEHLVVRGLRECSYVYNRAYGKNWALTAVDRCGNESDPVQLGGGRRLPAPSAGAHYLPTDGRTLPLPAQPEADYFMITDLAGRSLLTGRWTTTADISRLPRGVYRLCTLGKRAVRPIAEFKK